MLFEFEHEQLRRQSLSLYESILVSDNGTFRSCQSYSRVLNQKMKVLDLSGLYLTTYQLFEQRNRLIEIHVSSSEQSAEDGHKIFKLKSLILG